MTTTREKNLEDLTLQLSHAAILLAWFGLDKLAEEVDDMRSTAVNAIRSQE